MRKSDLTDNDQERVGESYVDIEQYRVKWTLANEFELLFIVVYQKIIELFYIDDLLKVIIQWLYRSKMRLKESGGEETVCEYV